MAVTVKTSLGELSYRKAVNGLRRLESQEITRNLNLGSIQERALRFLHSVFPDSRRKSKSPSSLNEFGAHLTDGWRVMRVVTAQTVEIKLVHLQRRIPRVNMLLQALDTGSKVNRVTPEFDIHFLGKRLRGMGARTKQKPTAWVILKEGVTYERPARSGTNYTSKTYAFLRNVLIPEVAGMVNKEAQRTANG